MSWAFGGLMLGHLVAPMLSKKMPPFGLMFSQFQPRPKKNYVWVGENRPFWAMPQQYWAYPVPSRGYVGPILQQLDPPSKFLLHKGENLGYSTDCQPGVVLYKTVELGPSFCICIHFVVDSFQILICIL